MDYFANSQQVVPTRTKKPIYCNVQPPQYLSIGEGEFKSGCAIIEVIFPNMTLVNIGEIALVNNYTAHLSLKAKSPFLLRRSLEYFSSILSKMEEKKTLEEISKREHFCVSVAIPDIHKKTSSVQTKVSWKTALKKFSMMPNPHCENGSQDYFTLTRKDLCRNLTAVSALRFVLYQPSPNWKTFSLEELYIYPEANPEAESEPVPRWLLRQENERDLSEEANTVEQAKIAGLPDPDDVSKHLHEMLRLTEKVEEFRPAADLGRFDIDGCYEINLLSYT